MNGLKKAMIIAVLVMLGGVGVLWGIKSACLPPFALFPDYGDGTFICLLNTGDGHMGAATGSLMFYSIVIPLIVVVLLAVSYAVVRRAQRRRLAHGRMRDCPEWSGSRFCRPGGLPGGMAPDFGRNVLGVARGTGDAPPEPAAMKKRGGRRGRRRGGSSSSNNNGNGIRARNTVNASARMCAVLDTNTAVMYGKYASGKMEHKIPDEFRNLLRDSTVQKVVTPAVMAEVRGLCRSGRLPREAADRIGALAVRNEGEGADVVVRMVEAVQDRVAEEAKSETAMRWLAAKRRQHKDATGEDYGNPSAMSTRSRRRHLAKLCEMAAGDRTIMGEAALVAAQHGRTVLLSADADVSLFADVLKRAAGGRIGVVGIDREARRRRERGWE